MLNITIVGAGVHGARMADKYRKFSTARIRAVVSPHMPSLDTWQDVPFFVSANAWKKKLGKPRAHDVFDLCVHQDILLDVLKNFIHIGAKNFILPKPIALQEKELRELDDLMKRNHLHVLVASQWHYSAMVKELRNFMAKHQHSISEIKVTFSGSFSGPRGEKYTAYTAHLPHIVQIFIDAKITSENSFPLIEFADRKKISFRYREKYPVQIVSDLTKPKREERIEIFLKGTSKPIAVFDFSRLVHASGRVVHPSATIGGKRHFFTEDVLEAMIRPTLQYFGNGKKTKTLLTLDAYTPAAKSLVHITERAKNTVAIIGGGIFGIMSALEIAEKGYPVVIFEKESEILTGASLVNQCRVHMGYHYPRDTHTAKESLGARTHFEQMFRPAIRRIANHYLVAKEGSLTDAKGYEAFCKAVGLPYQKTWPRGVRFMKEKISQSHKVPEAIFDAKRIREILKKRLVGAPNVLLLTSANVTHLCREKHGFRISYQRASSSFHVKCAAVVNAAYANANHLNRHLKVPLQTYQYELCEMPVVKLPWRGVGWSVIDGPFFGAIPFGFSNEYLLYDVELSVLERIVSKLPKFKFAVAYYDHPERRSTRFLKYQKKWAPFTPEIKKAKYSYSLYTPRVVLPWVDKTDARPTLVNELVPGFWHVFSGKVTTSITNAREVARAVDLFLQAQVMNSQLEMPSALPTSTSIPLETRAV